MYRKIAVVFLLVLVMGCAQGSPKVVTGKTPTKESSAKIVTKTVVKPSAEITTLKDALAAKLPIVLELGSPTCHYCVQMEPIMAELKNEYAAKVVFLTLDVYQNMDMAKKFNVTGIPAFIFYDAKGSSKGMVEGAMSKNELIRTAKGFGIIK